MLLAASYRSDSRSLALEDSFDSKRGMFAWLPSARVGFAFDFLTTLMSLGEIMSALLIGLASLIL